MLNTITVNGNTWPVNFGTSAIMKLEKLTGITFYDWLFSLVEDQQAEAPDMATGLKILRKAGVAQMVNLLYCGIYGGCLKNKKECIGYDQLIDDLDAEENMLEVLVQGLLLAFTALPKPKEGAEKKSQQATA